MKNNGGLHEHRDMDTALIEGLLKIRVGASVAMAAALNVARLALARAIEYRVTWEASHG